MDHDPTPINARERRRPLPVVAESAGLWLEEHLIWPLQDRGENLGAPGRALAALAAVLVVAVAVAAAIGVTSGGEEEPASSQVAAPTAVAATGSVEKPATEKPEPTLKGAAPVFEPTKEEKKTANQEPASPAPAPTPTANPDAATATIGTQPGSASSSAATSSTAQSAIGVDGPPAGPEAIAVAEDFAGAFVLYETGGEESVVREAFAATATPELAKSLLRRPPRLPANVDVPKAKVVNVVAGPSHGGVYTISVSLLRVGLTSELRLDMEKQKKSWRVTNVLG
jgi:hypothetical protein